jgi:putative oxidoreductase
MHDVGLLVLRLGLGSFMIGHGAQKLFGWWKGHGIEGTGQWLESLGLRPGQAWATLAGASEFAGGSLTALGALYPLGPLAIIGSMVMASTKAHAGRPVWVTEGGAELPLTNAYVALALMLIGPGRLSVDRLLGLRMSPVSETVVVLAGIGALAAGLRTRETSSPAHA